MKLRNPFNESDDYPELTSLIDVMFLLLIFFLLTTSFEQDKKQNIIEVELPISQHSQQPVIKNEPVYIGIDKSGDYILNSHRLDKKHVFEELKVQISNSSDSVVVIHGDRMAPYHAVVFVYDMLQALGVKHFSHQVQ